MKKTLLFGLLLLGLLWLASHGGQGTRPPRQPASSVPVISKPTAPTHPKRVSLVRR